MTELIPRDAIVRIIDDDSQYFNKRARVTNRCRFGREVTYHLDIDGEENDWDRTQLEQISQ